MSWHFNWQADTYLRDWWNGECTLAVNPDGTGGAPAANGAVGYVQGLINGYTLNAKVNAITPVGPAYKAAAYNGHASFGFNGSTTALSLNSGAATLAGFTDSSGLAGTACEIVVVYKATGNSNVLVSKSGSIGAQTSRCYMIPGYGEFSFGIANSFFKTNDGGIHVLSYSWDDSVPLVRCSLDGCGTYGSETKMATLASPDTTNPFLVGAGWTGTALGSFFSGEILALGLYGRQLLPWERLSLNDQLCDYYGKTRPLSTRKWIPIFNGNSLASISSYCDGINNCIGMPAPAPSTFGGTATNSGSPSGGFINLGWGSKTGAEMVQYAPTHSDPVIQYLHQEYPTAGLVYGAWEQTNDMQAQTSAAAVTAVENIENYVMGRRATADSVGAAIKFWVAALLPRSNISVQSRQIANLQMKLAWPRFADAYLDWEADAYTSAWCDEYDYSLNPFYAPDSVHYAAGLVASNYHAAMGRMFWTLAPASSPATYFTLCDGSSVNSNFNCPGATSALFVLKADGTYSGTVTVTSSNAGDSFTSSDPTFTNVGGGACTFAYTGEELPKGFRIVYAASTTTRTMTVSTPGLTPSSFTRQILMTSTAATWLALQGSATSKNSLTYSRAAGVPSTVYRLFAAGSSNGTVRQAPGSPVTATVSATNGATITLLSPSWVISSSQNEVQFEVTHAGGLATTLGVTNSGTLSNPTALTNGGSLTLAPYTGAPTLSVAASPVPTGHPSLYATWGVVVSCLGLTSGTVNVTPHDDAGGTLSPSSLAFTPTTLNHAVAILPQVAAGTHHLSFTNDGGLSNPATQSIDVAAARYAMSGPASATAGSPVTIGFTSTVSIPASAIRVSDGGAGGSFGNGGTVLFAGTDTGSLTYQKGSGGPAVLTAVDDFGAPISGSPFTLLVQGTGGGAPAPAPNVQPGRIQPGGPSVQPGRPGVAGSYPPPTGTPVLPGIAFHFSEAIVATGLSISVVVQSTGVPLVGSTTYDATSRIARFDPSPSTPLVVGVGYLVTVSGATASDGTPMVPESFPFRVGLPPRVRWFPGLSRRRSR